MPRSLPLFLALMCTFGWQGCTEPVMPNFALGDAFYLVEGSIIAEGEGSEIRLQQSNFREVSLQFQPVTDALVQSLEAGGQSVVWSLSDAETGSYRPSAGFRAAPGQTWHFDPVMRLEDPLGRLRAPCDGPNRNTSPPPGWS